MFVLLGSLSPAMADGEVAYVDLQRALLETNEGKQAKAELEKMKTARQKQLDERQKQLKALQQSLESQRAFMKEDVLRKKEAEFGQQLRELQMTYASLQKELAAEEGKLTNKLLARMLKIVEKIGKERKYAAILERNESRVLWAPSKHDLTNEIIRLFDASKGK
jgi:outer membrane protein